MIFKNLLSGNSPTVWTPLKTAFLAALVASGEIFVLGLDGAAGE